MMIERASTIPAEGLRVQLTGAILKVVAIVVVVAAMGEVQHKPWVEWPRHRGS